MAESERHLGPSLAWEDGLFWPSHAVSTHTRQVSVKGIFRWVGGGLVPASTRRLERLTLVVKSHATLRVRDSEKSRGGGEEKKRTAEG